MNLPGRIAFQSLRGLERCLAPSLLAHLLRGFSSAVNQFKRESWVSKRELLGLLARISDTFPIPGADQIEREQILHQLDRMASCWPDRYREEKWKKRCRIEGLGTLQELAKKKRAVVLPTFHFGPMFIQRYWLRVHDLPVAGLVAREKATRSPFRRETDRLSGKCWPHVFLRKTELKKASQWLKGGGMLLIPIDVPTSRDLTVCARDGYISLSTGFARWALRYSAVVIPTLIFHTAPLEWEIHLGPQWSPEESSGQSERSAIVHTVNSLFPILEKHPEQIRGEFFHCIVNDKSKNARPS